MQMGINTPLLSVNCAYKYFDITECYNHLQLIGKKIVQKHLPKELCPMVFAITGRGRTAQGCL
jgi:alpha-aminoadipic semialdehyde synthase